MKIEAKITWLIDELQFNIRVGKTEHVLVDMDYLEDNEDSIIEWVENELFEKYGMCFYVEHDDFVIENIPEIIEDIQHDE